MESRIAFPVKQKQKQLPCQRLGQQRSGALGARAAKERPRMAGDAQCRNSKAGQSLPPATPADNAASSVPIPVATEREYGIGLVNTSGSRKKDAWTFWAELPLAPQRSCPEK